MKYKNKKLFIAYVLIVSAISLVFLLPWFFSILNSNNNYYGLYVNKPAEDFSLTDTDGHKQSLALLSGSYSYLMFGFTNCQEVCPLQLGNLLAMKQLVNNKPVNFVFISLDPERDTAEVLQQYFDNHGENFIALRPESFQASQALAMKYHEFAYLEGNKSSAQDYVINHNGYIFLLNPEGILKLIYTSTQLKHDKMYEDLQKIMQNS